VWGSDENELTVKGGGAKLHHENYQPDPYWLTLHRGDRSSGSNYLPSRLQFAINMRKRLLIICIVLFALILVLVVGSRCFTLTLKSAASSSVPVSLPSTQPASTVATPSPTLTQSSAVVSSAYQAVASGRTSLFNAQGEVDSNIVHTFKLPEKAWTEVVSGIERYTEGMREAEIKNVIIVSNGDNQHMSIPKFDNTALIKVLSDELTSKGIDKSIVSTLIEAIRHSSRYSAENYPIEISYVEGQSKQFLLNVSYTRLLGGMPGDKNYYPGVPPSRIKRSSNFGLDRNWEYQSYSHLLQHARTLANPNSK
jgi:hypothetical protein